MSYVKRMAQQSTLRKQGLVALGFIAALIFSLGIAADSIGRSTELTTVKDRMSGAVVVSQAQNQPATVARVPYEAGWQLYDNGWAGGPTTMHGTSSTSTVARVPYEAGWQLYDNGWAGGPATALQNKSRE